jgi:DNA repair photolyase
MKNPQHHQNVYHTSLREGIRPCPEFTKKGLAQFSVNVGTKCSHDCLYCSTGSSLRTHASFKRAKRSPFTFGYAIVDPGTAERVARDARDLRSRGLVQLCTTVDAWAPEARAYNLGRLCLEEILKEPGWSVRVLTKNASVIDDYAFMRKHRDRVLVGLSLTGTRRGEKMIRAIEPHASSISERMKALRRAHQSGLRTFGMLCPLLPGIAHDEKTIAEMVEFCVECGAEEIFAEPVNPRGPGLRLVQEALVKAGFQEQAAAVGKVRKRRAWSAYTASLIQTVQRVMKRYGALDKLRFLLYPANLHPADLESIRRDDTGVRWLGEVNTGAGRNVKHQEGRAQTARSAKTVGHAAVNGLRSRTPRCEKSKITPS